METPLQGLYVTGNITGNEGAKVAISQGKVAGYSMLNKLYDEKFQEQLESAVRNVKQKPEKSYIQFHPHNDGRNMIKEYWEMYEGTVNLTYF